MSWLSTWRSTRSATKRSASTSLSARPWPRLPLFGRPPSDSTARTSTSTSTSTRTAWPTSGAPLTWLESRCVSSIARSRTPLSQWRSPLRRSVSLTRFSPRWRSWALPPYQPSAVSLPASVALPRSLPAPPPACPRSCSRSPGWRTRSRSTTRPKRLLRSPRRSSRRRKRTPSRSGRRKLTRSARRPWRGSTTPASSRLRSPRCKRAHARGCSPASSHPSR